MSVGTRGLLLGPPGCTYMEALPHSCAENLRWVSAGQPVTAMSQHRGSVGCLGLLGAHGSPDHQE